MPTPKEEYVNIADLPKSKRGMKEIPKEWVTMIQRIPSGKAMIVENMKYGTVTGRIKALKNDKVIGDTYKVMQRKTGNKSVVYIAHAEK